MDNTDIFSAEPLRHQGDFSPLRAPASPRCIASAWSAFLAVKAFHIYRSADGKHPVAQRQQTWWRQDVGASAFSGKLLLHFPVFGVVCGSIQCLAVRAEVFAPRPRWFIRAL